MPGMEESFNLNLGEVETSELESYEAAEKFLAGDGSDIKDIKEEEKEEEKKEEQKPEDKKKPKETPEQKAAKEKLAKVKEDPLGEIEEEEEEKEEEDKKKPEAKKKEETEEEEEQETEEKKEDKLNQFEAFSKDLIKIGALSDLEEGEKLPATPEEFLKKFNEDRQRGAIQWLDSFLAKFGDDRRQMFEAVFINGADPKDYLSAFSEMESYDGLDITDENNQKSVFREFYRRLGWEEPDIEKKLQKTIDYGDLETDTKKYYDQIVKQDRERLEDIERQAEERQQTQKRLDEQYKISVQNALNEGLKAKEINGVALNDQAARKAFDFLYTKKYKLPDGQLLTEFDKFVLDSKKPENIQKRLLIALLHENNFDFSSIKKKGVTEQTNSIFETVQRKTAKKNRETTKEKTPNSSEKWFSL